LVTAPTIGVLGLQGAVAEHRRAFADLGVCAIDVRTPDRLDGIDALVIPGGESTTISMLLERGGLFEPVAERLAAGMPALGTCAGMILLASDIRDGRPDQRCFGAIDVAVVRNGYGRQLDSFESDVAVPVLGPDPFRAVFIRAPVVESTGPGVEVLARVERPDRAPDPVVCRQGAVVVTAFHPELTDDRRLHRWFLAEIAGGRL
jgi:pyridoxal 5'-phosphate synthase pdxT subunit